MHRTMRSSIRGLFVLSEPWEIDGRPNDNMGLFQSSPTAVFDLRKTKIQIQSTNKKNWPEIMVRFTQFPIYTGFFQVQVWEIDGRRNDNEIFQDFHPWRNFSHHLLLWSVPSPQSNSKPPNALKTFKIHFSVQKTVKPGCNFLFHKDSREGMKPVHGTLRICDEGDPNPDDL